MLLQGEGSSPPASGGRCALPGPRPWCPYHPCLHYRCLSPSANRNSCPVSCRRHACAAAPHLAGAAGLEALLGRGLQPLPSPAISLSWLCLPARQRWAAWHRAAKSFPELSGVSRTPLERAGGRERTWGWRFEGGTARRPVWSWTARTALCPPAACSRGVGVGPWQRQPAASLLLTPALLL